MVGPAPQNRGEAALAAGRHQSLEMRRNSICRENDHSFLPLLCAEKQAREQRGHGTWQHKVPKRLGGGRQQDPPSCGQLPVLYRQVPG